MKLNYKTLGDYIEQVNNRNRELRTKKLMGININKNFMPSVANVTGTDLSKYKLISKNEFAFNPMHVGRDKVLPIALYSSDEEIIVSPAYITFKVKDETVLNSEYLMMWLKRPELDRRAWFTTDSSVRGGFSWEDFCAMELPIPSIEVQKEIVKEYNIVQNNIITNENLIKNLEDTAQAIYKEWFIDFNFPDETGKPYKKNGGAMEYNEVLEKEIPLGWVVGKLGDACDIKAGGDKPKMFSQIKTVTCNIPIYSNGITDNGLYGFTNKSRYPKNSVTVSARGTIGFCALRTEDFDAIVRLLVLMPNSSHFIIYLWQTIKSINFNKSGSVQEQLTVPQISTIDILLPKEHIVIYYNNILSHLLSNRECRNTKYSQLKELSTVLLSKMAL